MSDFPLDPLHSKIILTASQKYSCVSEAVTIVAMLNVPNIFIRPRDQKDASDSAKAKFTNNDGDHLTLLNVFTSFKQNGMDADWCWSNYLNIRALK